jgi:hypothetical protein
MNNLISYCCFGTKELPDFQCETANRSIENLPSSPYLFDHLIDVGMRRLDADEVAVYGSTGIVDAQ